MKLGDWLESANIGAVWLPIGFIAVTLVVDLIMPAAIAEVGDPCADLHSALHPP